MFGTFIYWIVFPKKTVMIQLLRRYIGERKDKHIMETELTDDDGKVIVEPLKSVSI